MDAELVQALRRDRTPLSRQIARQLTRVLSGPGYPPGTRLPSETELAEMLNVSRATVRDALRLLELDGWVERRQGVGTTVTDVGRLRNYLDQNYGVTDLIRSLDRVPGTRETRIRRGPASHLVADKLQLAPDERVVTIERVRTADGQPVIVSIDILPERLFPPEAEDSLGEHISLYQYLEDDVDTVVAYGIATMSPARATKRLARQLDVSPGALLLRLYQVDYDREDRPIMVSEELHNPSCFDMTVRRRGPGH